MGRADWGQYSIGLPLIFLYPMGKIRSGEEVVEFIPFHCVIIYIKFVTLSMVNLH